ncbi:MAG: permease [Acidobacteria bacterium]|nr:MAG: permease [Acidobacteriota bacterium]PYR10315.1 MAG: permease [Acidobacteriota bacterium]
MGWVRRLRSTFSRTAGDFDEERRFHIDERTDEYVRNGMSREEARRAALKRFGNATLAKERTLDVDVFRWIEDLRRDTGYALRMLWRSPGFTVLAIVCLTLGIGANIAVFSWIEGILLRPYPLVVDQDRLFAVTGTNRGAPGHTDVSWPDWLDLQRASTLAEAFIGEKITGTTLSIGDRAERASGSMVSANYFDAIGVRPVLGRSFEPGEDSGRNAHPVTVISYEMWRDRFHGDPGVIGKTQVLSGLPHTIVGVAPKGFYGTFVGYAFQFWVPASMQSQFDAGVYKLEDRGARWIEGYVRLKPGVTIEQAQAEMSAIAARLEADYPETNRGRGVKLFPLWQTPFNNAGALLPTLAVALVVVLSVLLIACANVGNLLLVRAFARQQEMTIRLSVGAGRGRLVKQLMTEGLILSAIAAAGGLLVANWLRDALALLTPPRGGVVLRLPGELDWRVLAVSAGVCLGSTVLFGLVPAMLTSNIDLAGALRSESGGVIGGRSRASVRSTLVLVQVSLSFVLLVGAGLLIQSLQAVRNASPGFSTDGVLTTGVDLFTAGYDPQRAKNFQDELIDRLQALGGVESAALSRMTPFSYRNYSTAPIAVDGYDAPPDQQPAADYNEIGPGFLATMGIPLVSGREFTRADNERAPLVAVVDETMAAQFWRGVDPVGRRVQVKGRWMQIVGLARNARYRNLLETPKPFFYVALRQNFSATTALQLRTAQRPAALAPALVREIHALDANVAPSELITMREQVDRTTAAQRISVTILVVFGALALVLAAIGLYGVMASTVSQSSRELALRMALGAGASDLLGLVLSQGLALTAGGVVVGLVAALQVTRLLGYLLYKVSPRDPLAFASAFVVIAVASLVACFVPAWRAVRTDPLRALRG